MLQENSEKSTDIPAEKTNRERDAFMKLVFVRHAEPDYSNDSLTEKGRREAQLLSMRLKNVNASHYYVSPLGRAKATAAFTLSKVGKVAQVLPWLAEFRGVSRDIHTGNLRICWDFLPDDWKSHPLLFSSRWLDDEMMQGGNVQEVWQETVDGMESVLNSCGYYKSGNIWKTDCNTGDTLVFFCHFGIMAATCAYLMGVAPPVLWQSFCCFPSGVTTLVTEERVKGQVSFRCTGFGDMTHLYSSGEPCSLAALYQEIYDGTDSTWPYSENRNLSGFII